jgi:hypothetical protein
VSLQADVEHGGVDGMLLNLLVGFGLAVSGVDGVAGLGQHEDHPAANIGVIIYQEDMAGRRHEAAAHHRRRKTGVVFEIQCRPERF